jgi:hypothetical protein
MPLPAATLFAVVTVNTDEGAAIGQGRSSFPEFCNEKSSEDEYSIR